MLKVFNNKMFLNLMTAFVGGLIVIGVILNKHSSNQPVVAIANWGFRSYLFDTVSGIKEELPNVRIELADAKFNPSLIKQNLYKLKSHKPKVIITIGTAVSKVAKNVIKDIPIVFVDVIDPVAAGLLNKNYKSFRNITGIYAIPDVKFMLSFIKSLLINVKTIGFFYSTEEENDVALLKMLQAISNSYGMKILASPINNNSNNNDGSLLMNNFKDKVDVIYFGPSEATQQYLSTISITAEQLKIPVFNSNSVPVKEHLVLGSFGVDHKKIGHLVGNSVKSILHGATVKSVKPVQPSLAEHKITISKKMADQYGIVIPQDQNITIFN